MSTFWLWVVAFALLAGWSGMPDNKDLALLVVAAAIGIHHELNNIKRTLSKDYDA